MNQRRALLLPLVAGPVLAVLLLAGCESEGIRSYNAKRPAPPPTNRMLGVIIPLDDEAWFFKALGRADIIALIKPDFDKLVDSIDINLRDKDQKVSWKMPEAWEATKGGGFAGERMATYKPRGAPGPTITIDRLGKAATELKPNIDRWRGQLGLDPATEEDLAKTTRTKKVRDRDITLVDMTGQGGGGGPMGGMMPPGHPPIMPDVKMPKPKP